MTREFSKFSSRLRCLITLLLLGLGVAVWCDDTIIVKVCTTTLSNYVLQHCFWLFLVVVVLHCSCLLRFFLVSLDGN